MPLRTAQHSKARSQPSIAASPPKVLLHRRSKARCHSLPGRTYLLRWCSGLCRCPLTDQLKLLRRRMLRCPIAMLFSSALSRPPHWFPWFSRRRWARPKLTFRLGLSVLSLGVAWPALAQVVEQTPDKPSAICRMIASAAQLHALPVDFLVRLLWQESRFQPDAVGPVTRSGARALGIAQFMPETAAERRLLEPFNPGEALPKSSEFLAELRDKFGNIGLAAAAYNAGPQRVREFIAGSRALPAETRHYVITITGRAVEDWAKSSVQSEPTELHEGKPALDQGATRCHDVMKRLNQTSAGFHRTSLPFISPFSRRKGPGWCEHLHHPKTSVCGAKHQGLALMSSNLRPTAH